MTSLNPPRPILQVALLAGLTLATYANSLHVPFLFDDGVNIVSNEAVHSLSNFTSLERLLGASNYAANLKYATAVRPVAYLTFALNYAAGGGNVVGYHLVNIAIHLATALLVFALTRAILSTPAFASGSRPSGEGSLLAWAPLLTASLFALHPVQGQAVNYVTQRFASLSAALYLSAVLCHVRWRLEGTPRRLRIAAVTLAVLAMTTKELAATLPAVLFGIELVFFDSGLRKAARAVWPFLAAVVVIPLLMLYGSRSAGTTTVQDFIARGQRVANPIDYLLTQTTVVVMYVRLLFWPARLNFDYDYPLYRSLTEPRVIASAVLLLALAGAAVVLLVRGRKRSSGAAVAVGFGVLWFLVTHSVESSVIPLADIAEEYRCYLPSVGLIWSVVFAVLSLAERGTAHLRRAAVAGLAAVALILAVATHLRNRVYGDEVSLWEDVVAKSPLKARARTHLSIAYGKAGRTEDSILQYQAATILNPEFRAAHGRLGVKQEEFELIMRGAAAPLSQRHLEQGVAAVERGDLGGAESEFRSAIKLDPANVDARSDLAYVHLARREFDAAVRENQEAVRLAPTRNDLQRNLGLALQGAGRTAEALAAFRRAVAIEPADAEAQEMIRRLSGQP